MKRAILSIDGGGIRGIIPICALVEFEKQTGLQARQVFSFMAGTSTGAIIVGALALGIPAAQLLEMYHHIGPRIFRTDWVLFAGSLGSYRYRVQPLREEIGKYLGDVTLNEVPVEVLVTATRVSDGHAWYFVRDNSANSAATGRLLLADCVAASAAAPTYFEPFYVPGVGLCVDGGVGVAGNPVYQACVEAFIYGEPDAYDPAQTQIVSLGTGYTDGQKAAPKSLLAWLRWTIGELLDAPSQQQTEITQRHFKTAGLIRLNPQLPYAIDMDDVGAMRELTRIGKACAAKLDWKAMLGL